MGAMASEITGVSIVCSTVCSGGHQRKHQSSASLAFLRWIHRWPVDSPHKGSVRREMFPFEYVIMETAVTWCRHYELLLMSFVVVGLGLLLERRTISTNNAPALWKVYMYAQKTCTHYEIPVQTWSPHIYIQYFLVFDFYTPVHSIDQTWWRHQMETFSALLALCAGNSPVIGEFPSLTKPVTRSFDVFFDLRLNKRLSKQSRRWWFETPSRSLWRHNNDVITAHILYSVLPGGWFLYVCTFYGPNRRLI